MAKVVVDGDLNRVFDQLQPANAKREKEQRELRQAAEVELLWRAPPTGSTRRGAGRSSTSLVEPKLPEDEMSYPDRRVSRTHDRWSILSLR